MAGKNKIERVECHLCQAVVIEAKIREDDEAIYSPTVPLVEGIAVGNDGMRRLRLHAEFAPFVQRLNGLPVVTNHQELTPDTRILGQLTNPIARADKKDAFAITKFYKRDITQAESEKIRGGKPMDGSINFSCYMEVEPGIWNDQPYDAREIGPYIFSEYSLVKYGVVSPEMGAGFNMQAKAHSHSRSSAPGGADMEIEEIKEMISEAMKPHQEKIAILEQSNTKLQEELKAFRDSAEAAKEAEQKALFVGKLKAGHLEKSEQHWLECKKVGYLAFEAAHPEMIIHPVQERKLQGYAMSGEGGGQPATVEEANKAHQAKMAELNQEVV